MSKTVDLNENAHADAIIIPVPKPAEILANEIQVPPLSLTKSGRFSVIGAPFGKPAISSKTIQEILDQDGGL